MDSSPSNILLSKITDQGLFELLATAILREADMNCRNLIHTGVNVYGKTIKSPVDGICFVEGANPPHLVAVHHTICAKKDLERKWLNDPTKVKSKKKRPAAPEGDFIKTASLVRSDRLQNNDLKATLILTTNQEPSEELVRKVSLLAAAENIELHIWSRSRLAHFLDSKPTGQWIRKKFLNIDAELLSIELFRELSKDNIKIHHPFDNEEAWISREIDSTLECTTNDGVNFLVAESGMGKTIACYKWLSSHIKNGGIGLVIPHVIAAESSTIEIAIESTLKEINPNLNSFDSKILSHTNPLFIVIEDVSRSGQAHAIIEKIAGWSTNDREEQNQSAYPWRLICPIWPEILRTPKDDLLRKRIEASVIGAEGFTSTEAANSVRRRASLLDLSISSLEADEIANELGNDPLMIALHDYKKEVKPNRVIENFIDNSIHGLAASYIDYTASDYLESLRYL